MRRAHSYHHPSARRRRKLRFFRPLFVELLETRSLLTTGLFIVQLDGLPDSSDDERIAAASERFQAAGLTDGQLQAEAVVDPNESILVQAPVSATLSSMAQELAVVPGFLAVDNFAAGASGDEEEEEGQTDAGGDADFGGGTDLAVGLLGFEPTLAVNPTNANNIGVAQYNVVNGVGTDTLKISTDGGVTFLSRAAVLPAGDTFFDGDDSLAFDAQGRLFWTYLVGPGDDVASLQINPTTGVTIGNATYVAQGTHLDKEWLAADHTATSPFANNIYAVWHNNNVNGHPVRFARSINQGATWTVMAADLSGSGEGTTFPSEVAVAPNGDVWTAWHTHVYDETGTAEEVRLRRSTDGGVSFGPEIVAFPAGTADATTNEDAPRSAGLKSIQIGSLQPRILIDPVRANTIYVISVDDPDNVYSYNSDPSDIVIARSSDNGAHWTPSTTLSHGPPGTIQVMPTAAIDANGNITVTWYDNRRGLTNAAGDWLLDLYASTSIDGGVTFGNDIRINDTPFDPDLGARDHDPPNGDLRIGEYNGLASVGGTAYAVWTGNSSTGQQILFDKFATGFQVSDSTPAQGQVVSSPPTDFVLQFTDRVDAASAAASDLTVNGIPADSLLLSAAGDTITFHYNTSPVVSEGNQTLSMAAGALARAADAAPLTAFSGSFFYDTTPLMVVSTTPNRGGNLTFPAPLSLDFNFSEPVAPASVQASDLTISGPFGASVTGVTLLNNDTTARFTIIGITREASFTASIAAAAINDPAGVPLTASSAPSLNVGLAFSGVFQADVDILPVPPPVASVPPLGSVAYTSAVSGVIGSATDVDKYTLNLDAAQTISLVVTADQTLQPAIQLSAGGTPLANASAATPGQAAIVNSYTVATAGTYSFAVSGVGGTTGSYTLHVYLNAAVESADWGVGSDGSRPAAQDLNPAFISLPAIRSTSSRASVIGSISGPAVTLSAVDTGWWRDNGIHTSNNKNYYVGQEFGHLIHDYFVFDLSSVRQPINAAQLNLDNPVYFSPDGSETFNLYDVNTPLAALEATGSGQPSAVYDDLGSGTLLGTKNATSASPVAVPLNTSGLTYLNATRGAQVALGGALGSISGSSDQTVFGGSSSTSRRQLALTVGNIDYYSFSLAAGQRANVVLKYILGSGAGMVIQNAAGTGLIAASTTSAGANYDLTIGDFIAPAAGIYYIAITGGAAATYDLEITRDAMIDSEPNDLITAPQPMNTTGGAVGAVFAASAQSVVPSNLSATEGNDANGFPFNAGNVNVPSMRYQQVYAQSQFNQAGSITAIRFRRNGGTSTFTTSGIDVKINLGYAATSFANPSTTFAENVGPGATTVFDGMLTLSSASSSSPRAFDVVINLTTPMYYDPSQGDLLLDVFLRSSGTTAQFDASNPSQQSVTRRVYATDVNATSGTVDPDFYGLVTRFDMTPNDDWYSFNLASTDQTLRLETSTPADGAGYPVNLLNPHLELYDPSNTLLVAGTVLADGRNERIVYQPTMAGTYSAHVTAEGSTGGEYVLTKNISPSALPLDGETLEDTPLALALLGTDPENDPLSFPIIAQPQHGTLSGTAPNLTYTPAPDYFGPDSFTYQVSDGQFTSSTVTVSLTVDPVNDAPTLGPLTDPLTILEDAGLQTINLSGITAGPNESQNIAITATSSKPALIANPQVTYSTPGPTGTLTFTPAANGYGSATITVGVQDDGGTANGGVDTVSRTFTVTVTPVNDAPTLDPIAVPQLVADINPGVSSASRISTQIVPAGGIAYTILNDGVHGYELWRTDGTAAGTVLVKDIRPGAVGSFTSSSEAFTNVNGQLFFAANDGVNGEELWKTDGTAVGTIMVRDINPGSYSSFPAHLTNVNGTLLFTAAGGGGFELWRSDGSSGGTVLVKDIRLGPSGSITGPFTNVNGTLFFRATDGVSGYELWKSDGTDAGTVLVKDIAPGPSGGVVAGFPITDFVTANGTLFFVGNDGTNGPALWKSDGTAAGTVMLSSVVPGGLNFSPQYAADVNGTLFFSGNDGVHGRELWKTDGTPAGTVLVRDIKVGSDGSSPAHFTNVNGTLFFAAADNTNRFELWKSDGTTSGTVIVKDISTGPFNGVPGGAPSVDASVVSFANLSGRLFFPGSSNGQPFVLWQSDGTAAGTIQVGDGASSSPDSLVNVNGRLLFFASDTAHGRELWTLTSEAQSILEDSIPQSINLTGISAGPNETQNLTITATSDNPVLIPNPTITYTSPASTGTLTYQPTPDQYGTATIIVTVKDDGGTANGGVDTFSQTFTVNVTPVNDAPTLAAIPDPAALLEDAAAQTINLSGISAGPNEMQSLTITATSSDPALLPNPTILYNNPGAAGTLSYQPLANRFGTATITVTVKDDGGTANGGVDTFTQTFSVTVTPVNDAPTLDPVGFTTTLVNDTFPGPNYSFTLDPIEVVNGVAYFVADLDGSRGELWKSDGTPGGTVRVTSDISLISGLSTLRNVNGTLFFVASNGTLGYELWKSDGTAAGTVLVKDITPGAGDSIEFITRPELTNVSGTLFFRFTDGIHGYELWKSDGTAVGTVLVKDIVPGAIGSQPQELTNFNGRLFFVAYDGAGSAKLWTSDGTAAGTMSLKDNALPVLKNINGTLFFLAGTGDSELWKSDGTAAGTVLVTQFAANAYPYNFTSAGGKLLFTANDGIHGKELWSSDGTAAGTVLVKDIAAGSDSANPYDLTEVNGTLFFAANDSTSGLELWKSDGTAAGTVLVRDIQPGPAGSNLFRLTNVNGTLFFNANDGVHGSELWMSAGTTAGTTLFQDLALGASGSYPNSFTNVNGKLFFSAHDGIHGPQQLWTATNVISVLEDAPAQSINLTGISAGPNETQNLTIITTSDNPALIPDPTITYNSPDSTGTLSFQPLPNQSGTATITVTVKDDGGTANGGIDSFSRTFTITVLPVNDPPSFTVGENQTATDQDPVQVIPGWAKDISAGAGDETGQKLSFTVTTDSPSLFAVAPQIDSGGQLSYTPAPNAHGTATVTVVLSDDGGTANGGVDASAIQQFTIAIHKLHPWHNSLHAFDVTGNAGQPDGVVSPLDALAVINYVNAFGAGHIPADAVPGSPYLDTVGGLGDHGDDNVAPIDALVVINYLNAFGSASPGPSGEGGATFETASSSLEPDGDLLMLLAMDVAAQAKRKKA